MRLKWAILILIIKTTGKSKLKAKLKLSNVSILKVLLKEVKGLK